MTRVRFLPHAAAQVWAEMDWWLQNRPKNPFLFEDELKASIVRLKASPTLGRPFTPVRGMRRYLMRDSKYHLYYVHEPTEDLVEIRAVWSAQRRRGPPLRNLR